MREERAKSSSRVLSDRGRKVSARSKAAKDLNARAARDEPSDRNLVMFRQISTGKGNLPSEFSVVNPSVLSRLRCVEWLKSTLLTCVLSVAML